MALKSSDLEVGDRVEVLGYCGRVVRIYEMRVDVEVAGVINRYDKRYVQKV